MTVESYFEDHKKIIEEELLKAENNVLIAVAWINFKEYFDIFQKILNKNVKLKILCSDNWQNRSHQGEIDKLTGLNAEIKLLKMPRTTNHMHHKFAIIDNETILNGSFNWSPNATSSFENIIIIREFPKEATKFISEFNKLYSIESKTIKTLQHAKRCKEHGCDGELFNVLVFSERTSQYYELYGDIIETCNTCEYYKTLESCNLNNQIEIMLMAYCGSSDEQEIEQIDRDIDMILDSYVKEDITIHAIGRVKKGIRYPDEDFVETNIIWKNKFVGGSLPDKFDDKDFDVLYDN